MLTNSLRRATSEGVAFATCRPCNISVRSNLELVRMGAISQNVQFSVAAGNWAKAVSFALYRLHA